MLGACASQAPEDQLQRTSTIRVCQGNQCVDQAASTVTFQGQPVDAQAEQRLQALEALAQQRPEAAYDLGLRLLRGDGVAQDGSQAIAWLRQAGNAGMVPAQLALGRLYLNGLETMGSDPAEAQAWLSRAAAQGDREAQQLLPSAQTATQDAQTRYQDQELARRSMDAWFFHAPYYWYWGSSGWRLQ